MSNFKISWEIEMEGESPLYVAKEAQEFLQDLSNQYNTWQFYVQNEETGEIFSVDLDEPDEDAVLPVKDYKPIIERR